MTINTIKYSTIVDAVKTYIKSNCKNITSFSSIPDSFKSGYTQVVNISSSGSGYTSRCKYTISTYVSSVAASTVDTDMTAFLTSIGVTNVNDNCTEQNYIAFINDIASFCATKLAFATSQFSSNIYLIYSSSLSYSSKINISGSATQRLAYGTDVTSQMNALFNVLKQNIRIIPCTYSISME